MIVVPNGNPEPIHKHIENKIINKFPNLCKNNRYYVYAISIIVDDLQNTVVYFLVEERENLLLNISSSFFLIVDFEIPSDWKVIPGKGNSFSFGFPLLFEAGFLDRLSGDKPDALIAFNNLKNSK